MPNYGSILKGAGSVGKVALRGAGIVGTALLVKDLLEGGYGLAYGNRKKRHQNRLIDAFRLMDIGEEGIQRGEEQDYADLLKSGVRSTEALETGAARVGEARMEELEQLVAPVKAQLAANAYREAPGMAETLARMGYGVTE